MDALKTFGKVIEEIYRFMCNVEIPVFGQEFPLWSIFLFGALGALLVWFIKGFFG